LSGALLRPVRGPLLRSGARRRRRGGWYRRDRRQGRDLDAAGDHIAQDHRDAAAVVVDLFEHAWGKRALDVFTEVGECLGVGAGIARGLPQDAELNRQPLGSLAVTMLDRANEFYECDLRPLELVSAGRTPKNGSGA
jgi:hypothetical protein